MATLNQSTLLPLGKLPVDWANHYLYRAAVLTEVAS